LYFFVDPIFNLNCGLILLLTNINKDEIFFVWVWLFIIVLELLLIIFGICSISINKKKVNPDFISISGLVKCILYISIYLFYTKDEIWFESGVKQSIYSLIYTSICIRIILYSILFTRL
jgi:hypothetical protein